MLKHWQSARPPSVFAELVLKDKNSSSARIDYLNTLIKVYNRQANEDKNEISFRTEQFINQRLEKIDNELGNTEGQSKATRSVTML